MKMGGAGSREMTALAKEICEFALSQKIIITAEYLPGEVNVRADWASRNFRNSREWLLSTKVFQIISQNWGTPEKDLFASRTCHQLHTYMAWRLDPHSQATDALQQKWKNLGILYASPPFSLIGRVLLRAREEGLKMILVTPNWPAQSWYSQILDLCITEPLLLPQSQELLVDLKETNGLENFRKNLVEKGISNTTGNLISNSRRSSTAVNYQSTVKKWVSWCSEGQIDPVTCSINFVLSFLGNLFEKKN